MNKSDMKTCWPNLPAGTTVKITDTTHPHHGATAEFISSDRTPFGTAPKFYRSDTTEEFFVFNECSVKII